MSNPSDIDVLVIGGGTAAFEAAVAARQAGAGKVLMLEKAPEDEFGGNARFSHTGFRFVHSGAKELRQFLPDLDEATFNAQSRLRHDRRPKRGRVAPGSVDAHAVSLIERSGAPKRFERFERLELKLAEPPCPTTPNAVPSA